MRYRIDRVYRPGYSQPQHQAPTIDEAHTWIIQRIKRAGKVGLHLRPLDFEVIDTWEVHPCLSVCHPRSQS